MKNNLNLSLGLLLSATTVFVYSSEVQKQDNVQQQRKRLTFIDQSFDDFVVRMKPKCKAEETIELRNYYSTVHSRIQALDEKQQRAIKGHLYTNALAALKTHHADWHKELTALMNNPIIALDSSCDDVRDFLSGFLLRCGIFYEWERKKVELAAASNKTLWQTVVDNFYSCGATIAGWFGGSTTKKVTA